MIKSILKLPLDLTERLLNAESDWVRYGIPALFLTIALSIAMANKSDNPDASRTPSKPSSASLAKPSASDDVASDVSTNEQMSAPRDSASAKQRTGQPPTQHPIASKRTRGASAGRIAVCMGVTTALPDYKAGKLRKLQAVRLAREAYRGQDGPQMAFQSVNQALLDYNAGAWSEADCPNPELLPKGIIGDIVNRRYHSAK